MGHPPAGFGPRSSMSRLSSQTHALHMRMFDDHDEQRALARYGAPGSLAAAALIFTLDGVPMLYNGMEVSDPTESGAQALFENEKVWWQAGQMRPDFPAFYKYMVPFRERQTALQQGDTVWVHNSEEAHVVSYLRRTKEEEFLIAINLSNSPFRGTVESAELWDEVNVLKPHRRPNTNEPAEPESKRPATALPALSLNAFQFRISITASRAFHSRLGRANNSKNFHANLLSILLPARHLQALQELPT